MSFVSLFQLFPKSTITVVAQPKQIYKLQIVLLKTLWTKHNSGEMLRLVIIIDPTVMDWWPARGPGSIDSWDWLQHRIIDGGMVRSSLWNQTTVLPRLVSAKVSLFLLLTYVALFIITSLQQNKKTFVYFTLVYGYATLNYHLLQYSDRNNTPVWPFQSD